MNVDGTFYGDHGDGQAFKYEVKGNYSFEEEKDFKTSDFQSFDGIHDGLRFDPDVRLISPSLQIISKGKLHCTIKEKKIPLNLKISYVLVKGIFLFQGWGVTPCFQHMLVFDQDPLEFSIVNSFSPSILPLLPIDIDENTRSKHANFIFYFSKPLESLHPLYSKLHINRIHKENQSFYAAHRKVFKTFRHRHRDECEETIRPMRKFLSSPFEV